MEGEGEYTLPRGLGSKYVGQMKDGMWVLTKLAGCITAIECKIMYFIKYRCIYTILSVGKCNQILQLQHMWALELVSAAIYSILKHLYIKF